MPAWCVVISSGISAPDYFVTSGNALDRMLSTWFCPLAGRFRPWHPVPAPPDDENKFIDH
jgi:hypothetical protein